MTNFSDQADNAANQVADQAENLTNRVEAAASQVPERAEELSQKADDASRQVPDQIESAKDTITKPLPTPPSMSASQASAEELLKRLQWGEPALTIVDVRSREAFNDERITGAVPISIDQIPEGVESTLERKRDIYIYGDSADQAASQLRQAGYANVAVLQGGLSAWKGIDGPTEGIKAFSSPVSA
ncbi:rhodanese-like domain-containing protein [Leptolyngbya sp. CCNP1308]|uniref:rhodanese-like domain-containing protein n=1 Tax=Leptolyngbya sp. CCNP1308 TaxID=3110255 RepID=UPI002B1F6CB4|nr:rhodanese-like domain-containing protein [Leptolyngbya sp. CCNP1308]MEA5449303.1 rhodanese-like domain-containing protein [Leptolyngbya sp. CCNP1308]